ncbi:putative undecaprenyl diphosphate synthase-domain-containing protein [Aspergillus unguis]
MNLQAKDNLSYTDRALLSILSYGRIPNHIALVMDGNRRYARLNNMAIRDGHTEGFANATSIISALRHVGVSCISFFMFGVDNFKRDPAEIKDIMEIIKTQVGEWAAPGGLAHRLNVRLNLCGERDMLDAELMGVLDYAMDVTRHYTSGKVNLCIAYSGRREIVNGIKSIASGQPGPIPYSSDLNGMDHKPRTPFTDRLWTKGDPPLDIIVRTSGETRLSDFMLWQCCESTHLTFLRFFLAGDSSEASGLCDTQLATSLVILKY